MKENTNKIMSFWDKEAPKWVTRSPWGELGKPIELLVKDRIESIAPNLTNEAIILDLGSGSGNMQYHLQRNLSQVISTDISNKMLRLNRLPKKIQLDMREPLPFKTNSIDFCVSAFTMRYLTRNEHVFILREIWRILKLGSSALILDLKGINNYQNQYSELSLDQIKTVLGSIGYSSIEAEKRKAYVGELISTGFGSHHASEVDINILSFVKENENSDDFCSLAETEYIQNGTNSEIIIYQEVSEF